MRQFWENTDYINPEHPYQRTPFPSRADVMHCSTKRRLSEITAVDDSLAPPPPTSRPRATSSPNDGVNGQNVNQVDTHQIAASGNAAAPPPTQNGPAARKKLDLPPATEIFKIPSKTASGVPTPMETDDKPADPKGVAAWAADARKRVIPRPRTESEASANRSFQQRQLQLIQEKEAAEARTEELRAEAMKEITSLRN